MDLIDIILAKNRGAGVNGVTLPIVPIETPLNMGETVIPESDPAYDTLLKAIGGGILTPMIAMFKIDGLVNYASIVLSNVDAQYAGNIQIMEDGALVVVNVVLSNKRITDGLSENIIFANVQFGAIPLVTE